MPSTDITFCSNEACVLRPMCLRGTSLKVDSSSVARFEVDTSTGKCADFRPYPSFECKKEREMWR